MTTAAENLLHIMTYNIKYATEEDGENSWSKRKERLSRLISNYHPEVFGVQEARKEQLDFLQESLDAYNYFGIGREGEENGLFNAIFYNSSKIRVLEEATFWLSKTPEEPSTGWDADYPRICTYGLFEDKKSQEKFWLFNTHFDHQGEEAVEESAKLIINRIREANREDLPAILLGDFNLEPGSGPIKYLSEQLEDSRQIAKEVAPGPEETFNAYEFHEPPIGRFDYIFVSDRVQVLKYAVIDDAEDEKYPSDHFPILLDLQFN